MSSVKGNTVEIQHFANLNGKPSCYHLIFLVIAWC